MVPACSFVPGEASLQMPPLTNARRVNSLSLCSLHNPQLMLSALGLLAYLLSRSRAGPSGFYPIQGNKPLKFQCLSPSDSKKLRKISPFHFPSQWPWINVLVHTPTCSTLSHFSLSPGLLPLCSTCDPISPQTVSPHFLPSLM